MLFGGVEIHAGAVPTTVCSPGSAAPEVGPTSGPVKRLGVRCIPK